MNKRILKFAEQALFESDFDDEQNIKITVGIFAELIVRECARVSERTGALNGADFEGEMIAAAIKEHFGVKE